MPGGPGRPSGGEVLLSDRTAAAFDAFYERAARRLYGSLVLVVGDPAAAADATQEAMAAVLERWDGRPPDEGPNPLGAAFAAAVAVAGAERSGRRRGRAPLDPATPLAAAAAADDAVAVTVADRRATGAALAALSPPTRQVLVARYYLQLTVPQIATALDARPAEVKAHLGAARASLHHQLGRGGDADDRLFHALQGLVAEAPRFAGDRHEVSARMERRRRGRLRRRRLAVAAIVAAAALGAGAVEAIASGEEPVGVDPVVEADG